MDVSKYVLLWNGVARPEKPFMDSVSPSIEEIEKYKIRLFQYEREKAEYDKSIYIHKEGTRQMEALFKKDALEETGFTNHPKAERIYAFADSQSNCREHTVEILEQLSQIFLD